MRGAVVIFSMLLALCLAQDSAEEVDSIFSEIMGNSSQCNMACSETYPLHTYDMPSNLEACDRGCRLFSICEWAEDDDDFNQTLKSCVNACGEAYDQIEDESLVSCKIGCESAVKPAKARKNKLQEEDPHVQLVLGDPFNSPSHLFFSSLKMDPVDDLFSEISRHPFMAATDNTMQKMMDYAVQFMQSDSLFSSLFSLGDKDSDEIIIISFHSPEINTQHPLEKQVKLNTDGNDVHSKTTFDHIESNLQTNLYGRNMFDSMYLADDKDIWLSDYYDDVDHYNTPAVRWWNCFTRKAGLPELALLVFWISTMMLLLMCCAMQFPSKKDNKLTVRGDLAYIKESKGRIPEFLRVYGHPNIVRFTEVKKYKPDEKIPLCEAC